MLESSSGTKIELWASSFRQNLKNRLIFGTLLIKKMSKVRLVQEMAIGNSSGAFNSLITPLEVWTPIFKLWETNTFLGIDVQTSKHKT